MEATVSPSQLRTCLEAPATLVDECRIHVRDDDLYISAVDEATVGMVETSINVDAFSEFSESGVDLIGVRLSRLLDALELFENLLRTVEQTTDSDNDGKSTIEIEVDMEAKALRLSGAGEEVNIGLLDPDSIRDEPDINDLETSIEMLVQEDRFDQCVAAANQFGDEEMSIKATDQKVKFSAEADLDSWDTVLREEDFGIEALSAETSHAMYSLDYLRNIATAIPDETILKLMLGHQKPMKIAFEFPNDLGSNVFILAPRIKSD